MSGGKGDDRYIVDSLNDVVIEAWNSGVDTVVSSVAFVLPTYVELLTLTGAATSGRGNAAGNLLTGSTNGDVAARTDGRRHALRRPR